MEAPILISAGEFRPPNRPIMRTRKTLSLLYSLFEKSLTGDKYAEVPRLSRCGSALQMTMVVTDPRYLSGPWEISWQKYYAPDYVFTEYECQLPFLGD